jgi:AsmA-like C-terminal region
MLARIVMNRATEERPETMLQPSSVQIGHSEDKSRRKKWLLAGAVIVMGIVAVVLILFIIFWPFTRDKVLKDLADATSSIVEVKSFQETYFPHPGCVAEGVTFLRDRAGKQPPVMTMERLRITGSFWGLFRKRLSLIQADGMRMFVLPLGSGETWPKNKSTSNVVVSKFVTQGATLEFLQRESGKRPLTFAIHQFSIDDLGSSTVMRFKILVANPEPPGEISASGTLGPWHQDGPADTPVSGTYALQHADLGAFHGIGGMLSSDGKVSGTLRNLRVQGATNAADFMVKRSNHPFRLQTSFEALVSGANGDIVLQHVFAHAWHTNLAADGRIAEGPEHKGKTTSLEMFVRDGRIEDVLYIFVQAPQSPLTGTASFAAKTRIRPVAGPFLRKVELEGDFGVNSGRFTNPKTQENVGKLSEHGRGEKDDDPNKPDPERVLSDLKGHVVLKDGTATFSNLSFGVPGALAHMHGTYNLITERIDLHGTLQLETKLSQATSGIKSFLIKALNPFLKNNKRQIPLPVSITGTYDHPVYKIESTPKK